MNEPWPKTEEELLEVIQKALKGPYDYNTSAEAPVEAALAAFNYVASEVGLTGFQAGWGQMQFIKRSRGLKHPFMLLDSSLMLYPQYNLSNDVNEFMAKSKPHIAKEAKKNLEEKGGRAHPNVLAHWEELANWYDNEYRGE